MSNLRTLVAGSAVAAALAIAAACGGSSSSPSSPTGSCTPSSNANTIVIQNNQVCPQALTVARGSQVTMINNDSQDHEMDSDPHPEHTDCVELNQIGFLSRLQQRSSGNLNTARRCGFHDHRDPNNGLLKGTITIQ